MIVRALALTTSALAAALVFAAPSDAAVTVLGNNSLAQSCYRYAEFGGSSAAGISTCTTALETQPLAFKDRAATLVNRGIIRARMDDSAGALADYDNGIHIDAQLAEAYVNRGATLIVMKRWDDALKDIDKGISLGARRMHIAYYDRAIVHEEMGDIRAAYEDYKKASELEPGFTLATQQLERFRVVRKKADGA